MLSENETEKSMKKGLTLKPCVQTAFGNALHWRDGFCYIRLSGSFKGDVHNVMQCGYESVVI